MKIYKGTLWQPASGGHLSLQVPDRAFGVPIPDTEEVPDDWIIVLRHRRPAIGRESGFSFLTKKGYEANKDQILKAFSKAGGTVEEFEQYVKNHFAAVNKATKKYMARLNQKIEELSEIALATEITL